MTEILKVSTKSNPNLVAGALVNILKEKENVEIHSIGAGALNQSIKAVAIARGFVAPSGKELAVIPSFWEVTIDGQIKTAIKLVVKFL
jgi:stage V sporulation protein S